ncbi:hypothetical protein BD830_105240 [Maritimibacter alkaliphilus HTCC2654]|uniref:Uncharacterized protein n=1 Tax=Maritimibacter alkaliphilus HTCC2654 TaxID=314271 RepID=A3VLE6_9RHOB|nr:hypothetical protein [Maritimibacter alkaliphilus]EAQ10951.1 hypothetical protein RB2654_04989 [Rhodobacterales bacterium HTCC2654] [Maritimibacter alkaliphilus HTCC2654]TYP81573.1 hypothetical protein BD830_105240 [Maritimibacter alkaliphilus HTCC2654]
MADERLTDKVKRLLPKDPSKSRKNTIRLRPDVGEIVCDVVLGRRTVAEVSRRTGIHRDTVDRFFAKFVTDDIKKAILADQSTHDELDRKINSGQDTVEKGLNSIITEQKELYRLLRDKVGDGRDIEDVLPGLSQLLRDQGQSYERLLKSYSLLKEKTTITLSINESPDWQQLQDVLYQVFEQYPDAFDMFRQLVRERRLRIE